MISNVPVYDEKLRLIIFSGGARTGRGICSCAAALYCAQHGQTALLVSTDGNHSLEGCLDVTIDCSVTAVKGIGSLYAVEIDPETYLDQYVKENETILKTIADRGSYIDTKDICDFFSLSLPGMDKLMVILALSDYLENQEYDIIILDTESDEYTIRLLNLINQMSDWIRLLNQALEKYRFITSVFKRYKPDTVDAYIETMFDKMVNLNDLLTDPTQTRLIPVMLPDEGSIGETGKLIKAAQKQEVSLTHIIVNRTTADCKCKYCQQRKTEQPGNFSTLCGQFKDLSQIELPLPLYEVRGISALTAYIQNILHPDTGNAMDAFVIHTNDKAKIPDCLSGIKLADQKYILITGTQRTGKTSIAAATGLYLANLGKRTLIYSTDPSPSLSGCFACEIGNKITPLPDNKLLYGLEINRQKLLDEFNQQYVEDTYEIIDEYLCRNRVALDFDRETMIDLIAPAPPCLSEVLSLIKLTETFNEEDYDAIVLDLAPGEQFFQILESPRITLHWFRTFLKLLNNYGELINLENTKELMIDLSIGINKIRSMLKTSGQLACLNVIVPEAVTYEKAVKLMDSILQFKNSRLWIAANQITPAGQCGYCSQVRVQQQSYIAKLRSRFSNYETVEIPLISHQLSDISHLEELTRLLYTPAAAQKH